VHPLAELLPGLLWCWAQQATHVWIKRCMSYRTVRVGTQFKRLPGKEGIGKWTTCCSPSQRTRTSWGAAGRRTKKGEVSYAHAAGPQWCELHCYTLLTHFFNNSETPKGVEGQSSLSEAWAWLLAEHHLTSEILRSSKSSRAILRFEQHPSALDQP